jgi:hypothetical protein
MNIFRFSYSLRLFHPTVDPQDISDALNLEPEHTRKAKAKSDSDNIERRNQSLWCSKREAGEDGELLVSLSGFLDRLEKKQTFLRSFYESGGSGEFFIGWFTSPRSGGETFGWELLSRIAALKLNVTFDVYGPDAS